MGLDQFIQSQHYIAMTPGGRAEPMWAVGSVEVPCDSDGCSAFQVGM